MDQYGQLVRKLDLGAHPSGPLEFSWDGINEFGEYAQPGTYNISVLAARGGVQEAMQTNLYSRVHSITMGGGAEGLTLNLVGSGKIPFSQVSAIQ